MENSFFHERAGFLLSQRSLRGCTFLRANRQIRHCVATSWLRQARRERRCLFYSAKSVLVSLAQLSVSVFCATSALFSKGKGIFTVALFLQFSRDFAVCPLPFVLTGWALGGNSAERPSLPPPGEAHCCREIAKVLQISATGRSAEPTGHRLLRPLQRIRRRDTNIFSGARKGVSPRRHTVFSSFVVPLAAFWSRQIPGRYFGRKNV